MADEAYDGDVLRWRCNDFDGNPLPANDHQTSTCIIQASFAVCEAKFTHDTTRALLLSFSKPGGTSFLPALHLQNGSLFD
jgi:hypothetical protein